jgi:hypothetical protein
LLEPPPGRWAFVRACVGVGVHGWIRVKY